MSKYGNKKVVFQKIKFRLKLNVFFPIFAAQCNIKILFTYTIKFNLQESFGEKGHIIKSIIYIADFQVENIVYDFKGVETEIFRIKKKLFLKKYPEFELQVVTNFMVKRGNWK